MSQCCLCTREVDTIHGIQGREFIIHGLIKLAGLELGNESFICNHCNEDLKYVEIFLQRLANSRHEILAEKRGVKDTALYDVEGQQSPLIEDFTDVAVSPPVRRRRRPPKRFEEAEIFTLKPCKTVKINKISKHFKNTQNPSLDDLPRMAYIQSSSSDLIGELVEVDQNGKHSRLRILCRKCSEVFIFEKDFRKHYAEVHGKKAKENKALSFEGGQYFLPEAVPVENLLYLCTICNKAFQEHFNVRRHYKTHNDERKFQCEKCPATFKYKFNMDYHMARHLDLRVHQCPQCEKKFVLRYELQIHLRIHTGERPFKCQICTMSFAHRSNLLSHKQIHKQSTDLYFKCCQCKASFRNRLYLKRHEVRVHKKSKIGEVIDDCGPVSNVTPTNKPDISMNTFDNDHLQNMSAAAEKSSNIYTTELKVPGKMPSLNMHLSKFVNIDDLLPKSSSPTKNFVHQSITPVTCSHITMLPKNFKIIKIPKTNENLHYLTQSLVSGGNHTNFPKSPDKIVTQTNFQSLVKPLQVDKYLNSADKHVTTEADVNALTQCFTNYTPNNYCESIPAQLKHKTDTRPKPYENHNLIITNIDAKDKMIYTQVKKSASVMQNISSNSEMSTKAVGSQYNEMLTLSPTKSVLKANISSQISLRKTPVKCKISPYSLLKQHSEKTPSKTESGQQSLLINASPPSNFSLIRKVEILQPLNLQEIAPTIVNEPVPPLPSSSQNLVHISAEYKFQCAKCWKYFKQKSALNKHMRTHSGEKPYKCNLCPKAYADASNYKKHKLLHTKAADALNISRPKPAMSPALSTASDPDPDGVEAMQTIQRFELSSDEDDMESYLWQDALQHSLMNDEIRENIKQNLMTIVSNAIMPAGEGVEGARNNLLSSSYFLSENPD